tara:strand:- start:56914 stop:57051 length:138 start_codon:yes stop_codon:yes gene_type:complete
MSNMAFWCCAAAVVTGMGLFVWQAVELVMITDALFDALTEAKGAA